MKDRTATIFGFIFSSLMVLVVVTFCVVRLHSFFLNFFPTDVLRIINKMSVNYFIFLLCFIATMGFVMIFAFAQEGQKGERDERNENT